MSEVPAAQSEPRSSLMTRWGLPLSLIALGSGVSVFVASRAPTMPSSEALGALPGLAFLVLLIVRAAAGPDGRTSDLVVTLLTAFLIGLHVLLLAEPIGVGEGFDRGVPLATAILFVTLAPVIATLEPRSSMGLRTRATLADTDTWRRAHRRLGAVFAVAGVGGAIASVLAASVIAVAWMGGLPLLGMLVLARAAALEQPQAGPRPNDQSP